MLKKQLNRHGAFGASAVLVLLLCICPGPQWPTESPAPVTDRLNLAGLLRSDGAALMPKDTAAINLACAERLPGAEGLDSESCLALIDRWTEHVRLETERHLYRFRSKPQEFDRSEAYFRMVMMAVIFCEDFGIRYNPHRITGQSGADGDGSFFADSRDLFLHGLCSPRRTGTCSSLPVLYAAVGRRLGYPLKLATTKSHLFLRWEGNGERLNLEATGRGMNHYDDDHYRKWPFPISDSELATGEYLKSLTPAEELALFLSLRGNCLRHAQRLDEAIEAYAAAARLAPRCAGYRLLLGDTAAARNSTRPPLWEPPPAGGPPEPDPLAHLRSSIY